MSYLNMTYISILMMMSFIISKHPFIKSLSLLGLCLCLMMMISSFGNWMNFILSFIYLGGVLVLFLYISCLIPNIKTYYNSELVIMWILMFIFMTNNFKLFFLSDYNIQVYLSSSPSIKYFILLFMIMLLSLFISSEFSKSLTSPLRLF